MRGASALAALCVASVLGMGAPAEGGAVDLTPETFKTEVLESGKNSFIKFLAPCKKMAPDWHKVGAEYEDSSSVLIGDVDCTVHQSLCSEYGVKGYPTLMFWKDGVKNPYSGGRTYDAVKKFVADQLEVSCLISDLSTCSDKEGAYHDKWQPKGAEAATTELARLTGMLGKPMKPELKQWLSARISLLKQLSAA